MLTEVKMKLVAGPVRLKFEEIVSFEPGGELVPYYHFLILSRDDGTVGHINFRVGDTRHVNLVAGHIGFEIIEKYRGHAYSLYACKALVPLIRKHYDRVVITADPDNAASIRIIEKLGAKFLDEVSVPADDPAYAGGAREKRRFEWVVGAA